MNSPVLYIVPGGGEISAHSFAAIRLAKPPRLYIAVNPLSNDPEAGVRAGNIEQGIAGGVDWGCIVNTLNDPSHGGLRHRDNAVDWFFECEEEGIIIEDGSIPKDDFFSYCDWALEAYRADKIVWHINGDNLDAPHHLFGDAEVAFTSLSLTGGWATWRNRWTLCVSNPFFLIEKARDQCKNWHLTSYARKQRISQIRRIQKGLVCWHTNWTATILNNKGLCVVSRSRLITPRETQADLVCASQLEKDDSESSRTANRQYIPPQLNKALSVYHQKMVGAGLRWYQVVHYFTSSALKSLREVKKHFIIHFLFLGITPIIVASTGRSGSTVLYDAIAESLVKKRFGLNSRTRLGRYLIAQSKQFVPRLSGLKRFSQPVIKTHDWFDKRFLGDAKCVFIYGDPLESAQSVELMANSSGQIWFENHMYNLNSSGKLKDIYEKDILNYENLIDSWTYPDDKSVYVIHYKKLWNSIDGLSRFLGLTVTLPEKLERTPKPVLNHYNVELFEHLRQVMEGVRKRN